MITLGIDAGTRATKAVLANSNRILSGVIVPCERKSAAATIELARQKALAEAQVSEDMIARVVATGTYANQVSFAASELPAGVCLARAMDYLNPQVRSVLDVGSVRTLAIKCRDRKLIGFAVNDRCASGAGAYVEALAGILRMPVEQLSEVALNSSRPVDFMNTCAVFVESEAISLLMSGNKVEDLLSGALQSFASRLLAFLAAIQVEREVAMVGGLAKNRALVKALEECLGSPLFVPPEPQVSLALGAALLASEKT